jgi:alginate O-acetyltransferase complex protein AlgI
MRLIAPLILLTLLVLAIQLPPLRLKGSGLMLLVFNLLFLLTVLDITAIIYLGIFLAISYIVLLVARTWASSSIIVPLGALVFMFVIFKRYEFLPCQALLSRIPAILGLSFIIFRNVNLLYEVRDRDELPSPLLFLNYTLSMFTFLSGPIQRYRAFKEDLSGWQFFTITRRIIETSTNRFLNGVIKVIFIAPPFRTLQLLCWGAVHRATVPGLAIVDHVMAFSQIRVPLAYGAACVLYVVFLYFNFSGYTDIVIALGRMAGFNLPENFDRPFKAESFLDFWNRWHISLSVWFRDYCFTPILKWMLTLGWRDAIISTLPAYFVCFGLLGIWHGRTWPFVLCGLMFSVAAVVNQAYRSFLLRSRSWSRHYRTISSRRLYGAIASSLTFVYVALAIQGFWLTGPEMAASWSAMTGRSALLGSAVLVASLACGFYVTRAAHGVPWIAGKVGRITYLIRDHRSALTLFAKALIIFCWLSAGSSEVPDFAYRGF